MFPKMGKMPRNTKGSPQEISGHGGPKTPHPNGGEDKEFPGAKLGKMGKKTGGSPVTHTPFGVPPNNDVHRGDTDTNKRMPRRVGGGAHVDPSVR